MVSQRMYIVFSILLFALALNRCISQNKQFYFITITMATVPIYMVVTINFIMALLLFIGKLIFTILFTELRTGEIEKIIFRSKEMVISYIFMYTFLYSISSLLFAFAIIGLYAYSVFNWILHMKVQYVSSSLDYIKPSQPFNH